MTPWISQVRVCKVKLNDPNDINVDLAPASASGAQGNQPPRDALPVRAFAWVGRFVLILVLLKPFTVTAQPELEWYRTYGGDYNDKAVSIVQTQDGGFAIVGYTAPYGTDDYDIYLIKTDYYGEIQWEKTYGGPREDWPAQIIEMPDGGFAIAGNTESFGVSMCDFWLVRTDSEGDSLWSRTYGMRIDQVCVDMKLSPNRQFVLAGWNARGADNGPDFWVVVADENGDSLSARNYGNANREYCTAMMSTANGGFVLAGGLPEHAFGMIAFDSECDSLWGLTSVRRSDHSEVRTLQQTENGGCLMIGYSSTGGVGRPGDSVGWIVEVDSTGHRERDWVVDGAGWNWFTSSVRSQDDGLILVGDYMKEWPGSHGIWIMKMSEDMDSLWSHEFDEGFPATCKKMIALEDGSYIIVGTTGVHGEENEDICVIKISSDLNAVQEVKQPSTPILSSIYPNPFNSTLTIEYVTGGLETAATRVGVYDVNGREVANLLGSTSVAAVQGTPPAAEGRATANKVTWDASASPAGVYFLKVQTGGEVLTKKVVLMR